MPADILITVAAGIILALIIAACIGYLCWWYAGRVDAIQRIEEGRMQPMKSAAGPWPEPKRRERDAAPA